MVSRRSFLKILGAAVAAPLILPSVPALAQPASAPLFVPSKHLDFGVPRRVVTATEMPTAIGSENIFSHVGLVFPTPDRTIPMMLVRDEYMQDYGGRLTAGSTVLTDQTTADRWTRLGIAVPSDLRTANVRLPARGSSFKQYAPMDGVRFPVLEASWSRVTVRHESAGLLSWDVRDTDDKNAAFLAALRVRQ